VEGSSSCLVSNRTFFWAGLSRDFIDFFENDTDYKISFQAKSASNQSHILKLEFKQTDGEGTRFLQLGRITVEPDSWTQFDGGFNFQINGKLEELKIKVAGESGNTEPFLVDDFRISKNNWLDNANARIENIRKSNLDIRVVNSSRQPLSQYPVHIKQLKNEFAFGSTMNEAVIDNAQYRQMFVDLFDWATIEWWAQWYPVELNRNIENYSIADQTLEFCQQNLIPVRGHAIAWSHPNYVPPWMDDLEDEEAAQELDERIESVVSRFKGQLASWDVCNEMLTHRYYRDRFGPEIRSHIFRRARQFDGRVPLFTNEHDIIRTSMDLRRQEYRGLINQLQNESADIGGIGIQGHFNGNTSPYNIERGINALADYDLPIWISEFDCISNNPNVRARQLENFYRYTFSRPEVDGIIMWGFWAGAHWRGPNAALVDLDWEINAAGQKFIELRNEWTTETDVTSDDNGDINLRGFHGSYIATANHPETGEPTYHIFPLSSQITQQNLELIIPDSSSILSIYGSDIDDQIEFDLGRPGQIKINQQMIPLPSVPFSTLKINTGAGDDTLKILGDRLPNTYVMHSDRLFTNPSTLRVEYDQAEQVELYSMSDGDYVNLYDTDFQSDMFISEVNQSMMMGPSTTRIAHQFDRAVGRSSATENDVAVYLASEGIDRVRCDENFMRVQADDTLRFSVGFPMSIISANDPTDRVVAYTPLKNNSLQLSPRKAQLRLGTMLYCMNDFSTATLIGYRGNSDVVYITDSMDSNETVLVQPGFLSLIQRDEAAAITARVSIRNYNFSNTTFSGSGCDFFRIDDSPGDELATASGDTFTLTGLTSQHTCNFPDKVRANGFSGGDNVASVKAPDFIMQFLGNWNFTK
ncbi:MAG: endo-1,4-beta-xylanase, partial [Planctomycetota bacterium]